MKTKLFFLLVLYCHCVFSQTNPVGIFQNQADIGKPKKAGSSTYDEATQTYTLKGAGYNIWFNRDEFQYLFSKISGDFLLTANFQFIGEKGNTHRKYGWMIRESAEADAAHVSAVSHGDGLAAMQWRKLRGAYMRDPEDEIFFKKKGFEIIQLERIGKKITMRVANPGEPLQTVGTHEAVDMPNTVLAGLYVCSHDSMTVEQVKVWNVRIDKPVPYDYNAGKQGYLGCRLEILNVTDGTRKVIRESKSRFEAPNWMPNGKQLLFNEGGLLYKIPIEGGTPEKLNTDLVVKNNNDHGISFDGKLLAISSSKDGGGSAVYVVPLEGGTPKLLTEKTPSYWHGWNPNNKEVLYVGRRESNAFNIYKVSVNGGPEIALTSITTGHIDGPEYSPDGKYIYYNANPTGTMQIWRMKPDGSGKEQVTFDEYHNWFPHISPDGKWIVIISFPIDIEPNSHPAYKQVMLRAFPTAGGAPRVIAHLYGGQGTINVPSWSPDSKYIAFVSNSE